MSDGGACSPFRSTLLVLTHDFIITCVYGPTGSELPPARLALHRQTSAQNDVSGCGRFRRGGAYQRVKNPATLAVDNGRTPHIAARHGKVVAREGGRYAPVRQVSGSEPLSLRTHRHRGRSR